MFKAFKTLAEMLEYRHEYDKSIFIKSFLNEKLKDYVHKTSIFHLDYYDGAEPSMRLICHMGNKFKASDVKKYFDEEEQFKLYILVIQERTNNSSNLKTIESLPLNVQVFDTRELQYNITKHVLVPKHEIIHNQEEINTLLSNFKIKSKTHLPIILRNDAMARFLNAQPGDIIKITRYSPSSGEHLVYRLCV